MIEDPRGEPWQEYRRLILSELERLNAAILDLAVKIDALRASDLANLRIELAMLKTKAAIFGSCAGIVSAAIVARLMQH